MLYCCYETFLLVSAWSVVLLREHAKYQPPTSPSTDRITMGLVEDDTILHPDVDEDYLFYISSLDEGHEIYTRFFDALLIKRGSHRAFFKDLRDFRQQPRVIHVLQNANEDRNLYRETTLIYLGSRFAHPWCRKTPLKKGFWRAEWGTIDGKKKDTETAKEEDRLHKLLVPIWVIMRSRMFPAEDIMKEWCINERARRKHKDENRLTMAALEQHNAQIETNDLAVPTLEQRATSDSGLDEEQRRAAAHAATSILRLAAAGMIISQTPKRKLRWLTKKVK